MRKLASVRKILAIDPILGANAIEVATVDGWKVVVKKDEFKVNQLAVYFEIDSWIPNDMAPFLSKGKEPREYNSIKGERLRTVKLRGQISQGLLVPLHIQANEGDDLTEVMGVQKYEPPVSTQLAGVAKGNFPSFIPKTDQERVQNFRGSIQQWAYEEHKWEITEKLDGSSMTVYINDNVFGVCSRNLDLIEDDSNSFWKAARKYQLEEILRNINQNLAIQGELIGPSIQGNPYELTEHQFYIFDIYDIKDSRYLYPNERHDIVDFYQLYHAPVLGKNALDKSVIISDLLQEAEGKSQLNIKTEREGLVYKMYNGDESFKVISNKFLLNER